MVCFLGLLKSVLIGSLYQDGDRLMVGTLLNSCELILPRQLHQQSGQASQCFSYWLLALCRAIMPSLVKASGENTLLDGENKNPPILLGAKFLFSSIIFWTLSSINFLSAVTSFSLFSADLSKNRLFTSAFSYSKETLHVKLSATKIQPLDQLGLLLGPKLHHHQLHHVQVNGGWTTSTINHRTLKFASFVEDYHHFQTLFFTFVR